MNSMTGFGRALAERDGRELTIELKSVNHRFLDVGMRLPRSLNFLEEGLRAVLGAHLSRGHVDVYVNYRNKRTDSSKVELNEALLFAYASAASTAAEKLGRPNDVMLSELLRMPEVMVSVQQEEDTEVMVQMCKEATEQAAKALASMRAAEGSRLEADLVMRVGFLKELLNTIEQRAPLVVSEYKQKLELRIHELLQKLPVDEARIAAEVAIFADKANITEEIVRLKSHFEQFLKNMQAKEPVGRKLDFIVQEFNREFNTIGSKAVDITILNAVMEAKGEVEKIREQIQNIE